MRQNWRWSELEFPQTRYYEIWARATDAQGRSQPMVVPGWNHKGYLNNAATASLSRLFDGSLPAQGIAVSHCNRRPIHTTSHSRSGI